MPIKVLSDIWVIIAVVLQIITLILSVTSLASVYWMNGPTSHFGLWNFCYEYNTAYYAAECYNVNDVDAIEVDGAFRLVQAFMSLGFIVAFVGFLLIFVLLFMLIRIDVRRYVLYATVVTIFAQGVLFFVAAATFLSKKSAYGGMDTDWAHFLAWVSIALSFITACVLVLHYAMNKIVYDED